MKVSHYSVNCEMGRTDKVRSIKRKNYDEGVWLWHNRLT